MEYPIFEIVSSGACRLENSGGSCLGRALVHEPHTLVLDEPTTGLDVQACFQYMGIIQCFIREGGTVILVTHHVHEIPPEVGRVVLLKHGRIIKDGFTGEVLHSRGLSMLFDAPVHLFRSHGWFHVMPARDSSPDDDTETVRRSDEASFLTNENGNG